MGEMIINPQDIAKQDFDLMVKINNLEVFTEDQFQNTLIKGIGDNLEKSKCEDLSDAEKEELQQEFEIYKAEIQSLNSYNVISFDPIKNMQVKQMLFTRPQQIEWNKDEESGELLKGIAGIYLDTELNRQLDRVGKPFSLELND